MQVVFQKGESLEYTAARDFGLNFEDRSVKSVKIRTGESVFYDGEIARYRKSSGEEIFGRCPSLKSAINVMGWLVLKDKKKISKISSVEDSPRVIPNQGDYDGFKGGSFDSFAARNNSGVYVAPLPPKMVVIKEQDRVVKEFHSMTKPENTPKLPSEKLDVSRDQVEVKKGFLVNSSTSVNKETKMDMPIVRRDEMGSERVTPIEGIKPPVSRGTKKASFILDEKTPLTIPEDMTHNEIEKMKTIPAEESQGATVVKRIGSTMIVQEVDGITMRKKTQEGITLTNNISSADREIIFTAKVTPGGEAITTIQDEGKIVSKIPSIENRDANAAVRAAERAAARKAAAKGTQAIMEKEKQPPKEIPEAAKAAEPENIPEMEETDVKKYMELLPQDWGKMHWTKKEAFIMACDNKALILFIRSMETAKAIINACLTRLKKLEQAV